jgi:hypothetical protein
MHIKVKNLIHDFAIKQLRPQKFSSQLNGVYVESLNQIAFLVSLINICYAKTKLINVLN